MTITWLSSINNSHRNDHHDSSYRMDCNRQTEDDNHRNNYHLGKGGEYSLHSFDNYHNNSNS